MEEHAVQSPGDLWYSAHFVSSPGAVGAFQRTIRDNHNGMTNCADLLRDNALKGGEKKAHCDSMIMESIRLIDELTGKDK